MARQEKILKIVSKRGKTQVSDLIKEGMIVPVKVIAIDAARGKISLSIKEADPNFFAKK